MYIPQDFKEQRPEVLHDVIREFSFGTLVSAGTDGLVASHIPFLLEADRGPYGTLVGHLALGNAQWRALSDEAEVLVMFQGPHAYISPSWYETQLVVPTWNYVAVHAYGRPRLIEDRAGLRAILEALIGTNERQFDEPWTMDHLAPEFVERLLGAIVGFEIPIDRIEGKFKLSQNRSPADQRGAIGGLRKQGTSLETGIAELMAGRLGGR